MKAKLWLPALVLLCLGLSLSAPAQGQVVSGTYTGNGAANRAITGVGFEPDVLIIKGNVTQTAVIRTNTMIGGLTKPIGATALTAGVVQSFGADGFTLGADASVNQNGTTYYWIAFRAKAGELMVNDYGGDGVDNRNITGVGFQPNYVIVLSSGANAPVHRSSTMTGDISYQFDALAGGANLIQLLQADGFQVGGDARVNASGTRYHYVAWKEVAGKMKVGSYDSGGSFPNDNRDITGAGFPPRYVIVKRQHDTTRAVHRPASLSGDSTLNYDATANAANMIQALQADGFQVGSSNTVNSSLFYHWMAFGVGCDAVADAADVAVAARSGQVTVYWSSPNPVLIVRKEASFSGQAPANGTTYNVGDFVDAPSNTAKVVFRGTGTSFTDGTVVNLTPYYYKVFAMNGACYASPIYAEADTLNATPQAGPPAWSYKLAGGSALRPGIAGQGAIYTSSNARRIISLSTANGASGGTAKWVPISTTEAFQGWLTWLPVGAGGIKLVKGGTATMAAAGPLSLDVTIPDGVTVDPDKSILFFSASVDHVNVQDGMVRGRLAGPTSVQFNRVGTGATITIRWYVAEFRGGVRVQRGTTVLPSTDSPESVLNVSIDPVELAKSFVLISQSQQGGGYNSDEFVRARLTSPTNLELASGVLFGGTIDWQVVSMAWASVQRGDVSLTTAEASKTVNLTQAPYSAVDPGKSFLLVTWQNSNLEAIGANWMRGRITDGGTGPGTQLTLDRGTTTPAIGIDLHWELVTLNDGSAVWSGDTPFGTTQAQLDVSVNPPAGVDTNKSVAFLSGNQRGGRTAYDGSVGNTDTPGPGWFTANLTSGTNLQLTRAATGGATADAAWFVVQFGAGTVPTTVIGGDQSGRVYSVDTLIGVKNWDVPLTADDKVQAAVSAQVLAWTTNPDFQAQHTDDVIFVATYNTTATVCGTANTNNKVFGIRASDGFILWTVNDACSRNDVDAIKGQPWVDYARNRLYVASRAGASGTQQSLWVIKTATDAEGSRGAVLTCPGCSGLGHLETSPTLSSGGATIYVGNTGSASDPGSLYAINANTLGLKWTFSLGTGMFVNGFVWEDATANPRRLYFSTSDKATPANGKVWCVEDSGTAAECGAPWVKPTVDRPATPLLLDKLLVGSGDGKVHQIHLTTGADEKQFPLASTLDGTPVGDVSTETGNEIFVGTNGGKIFRIDLVSGALP